MTPLHLLDQLGQQPLLCDGAMGTQLFAAGLAPGMSAEVWNLERPEVVEAVHRAYRQAGCRLLTTNSFGACPLALARHGLADQAAALNRAAATLAKRAADGQAWVLADLGPFGDFLEPLGDTPRAAVREAFEVQAAALAEGGADAAIVETMADPAELAVAVEAAKAVADWPVIACYAFQRGPAGFHTMMGATPAAAMEAAIEAGADVVGSNCGTDLSLEDYLALARDLVAAARPHGVPVILQANAGSPRQVDGRTLHPAGPEDMAALVPRLLEVGVKIIGGCCGTTPAHLAAMAAALEAASPMGGGRGRRG